MVRWNKLGEVPLATGVTVILGFLLGILPAGALGQVQLIQLLSPRVAKQFLKTVDWKRYEATQINIAEELSWEDPAIVLDLKGDAWKVEFPNDTFISLDRQFFGDIANPRPVEGSVRTAALTLLERNLVHVYRVRIGEANAPDQAIVLTPYNVRASVFDTTIRIRLNDWGLQVREEGEYTAF